MEKAKKLYYTNEVETGVNKPKASWDMISEVLGNSESDHKIGDLIVDCNTCNDDGIKANHANEFFTNIGYNLRLQFIGDCFFYQIYRTISSLPFHLNKLLCSN